jgi:gamma-glutamylcyclotransferase
MMVHYFAFGSNMSRSRMVARIPEAEDLGRGSLEDWAFRCDKSGMDGSAKANLARCPGTQVWGVVYRFPSSRLAELDVIEGGYRRLSVEVWCHGRRLACEVYASDRITDEPVVFRWYQDLMVAGAEQHGLPEHHIETLRSLPSRPQE